MKMTKEQALKDMQERCRICKRDALPSEKDCEKCYFPIAIESIERQIPKKPIIDFQESGDCYWYCPTCKEVVKAELSDMPIVNEYNHNHCGGCGQAIEWSEEDENNN